MFVTKDENEVKWYWYDGKMHTVKVSQDDEQVNLKELYDRATKIVEEKEELCKSIHYLGVALTGSSEGGYGFLMGWLVRSIKDNQSWQIQHTDEEVPQDEITEYLASMMEEAAKMIREKKGDGPLKGITPTLGGTDGTELFK